MAKSSIEWTEATWNPVTGCTKVSPGCRNCYAERMARRLQVMGQPKYVDGFEVPIRDLDLEITGVRSLENAGDTESLTLSETGANTGVFAGSIPRQTEVQKAKDSGAKVLCFASTESIAKRMIEYGADALILEGSEAGGHIGHVSTAVLLQEILFEFDSVPVFVAGGIGTGKMIAHLVLMGAAGAQMGTRFVLAEECNAHPRFKDVFIRARAREAISTPQYSAKLPVVSVRALNNHAMTHFGELQLELIQQLKAGTIGRQEAQYKVEEYWVGSLRNAAVDGDVEHGSLMAGQSVGMLRRVQPLRDILQELVDEADRAITDVRGRLA